jgi:hypothetical protein
LRHPVRDRDDRSLFWKRSPYELQHCLTRLVLNERLFICEVIRRPPAVRARPRGDLDVRSSTAKKLAECFGVTLAELMRGV